MSIIVAKLENNQHVIADFREVRTPKEDGTPDPDGELLFLEMFGPLVLSFAEYIEETNQYKVAYDRYMPFCKDPTFRIMPDKVLSVGRATNGILKTYVEQIFPNGLPEQLQKEVDEQLNEGEEK